MLFRIDCDIVGWTRFLNIAVSHLILAQTGFIHGVSPIKDLDGYYPVKLIHNWSKESGHTSSERRPRGGTRPSGDSKTLNDAQK